MNRKADQIQELQRAISDKEAKHSAEMAELRKRLADEQARATTVQPLVPAIQTQPSLAPGQGVPTMSTSTAKYNMISVATAISRFLKVAGIDEESKEAKTVINTLMQIGINDSNQIPSILKLLDEGKARLEKLINAPTSTPQDVVPQEPMSTEQIEPKASMTKVAGENPFAKKDDDKGEEKEEKGEKEEPKEKKANPFEKKDKKEGDDKKPSFPPKKEEKKDDKKEDKPEPKKEEKKDDKKEAPKKDAPKKEHGDEKKDEKGAKEAIKIIEDLLAKEEKEGEGNPHLQELRDALSKMESFLFGEKGEMGMPGMDMPGIGMPGLDKGPALEMKDPHKEDILKTGPAVPLPPAGMKPEGPALGLEKNLHPIPTAKPVGPAIKKLPMLDKAPKMDMAKEMGQVSANQRIANVSPEAQDWISNKIKILVGEGKSQEQAAAIAYSMAREKGYDVPEKKAAMENDSTRIASIKAMTKRAFLKVVANSDAAKEWWSSLDEASKEEVKDAAIAKAMELFSKDPNKAKFVPEPSKAITTDTGTGGVSGKKGDFIEESGELASNESSIDLYDFSLQLANLFDQYQSGRKAFRSNNMVKNSFNIHDRVWAKTANESYTIDDEPGRIVAIAEGKIIVDWGDADLSEEKPEDLIVAKPVDGEGTMFDAPPTIDQEVATGMNAFTPVSMNVEKVLSVISFADTMAQHIKALSDDKNVVDGKIIIEDDKNQEETFPFEL